MLPLNRRAFLTGVTAGVTAGVAAADARALHEARLQQPVTAALASPKFRPLAVGAIKPGGWLRRQLQIQADGLTGHLDEFWPDVARSQWFGGDAEGWERAPYWLDGAIPLAWQLDHAALKARITKYVEHIVANQRADGWYAPYPVDAVTRRYDMWAILLANKVLAQYHEATRDTRVLKAVMSSLRALDAGLDRTPLYDWGRFRWFEGLIAAFHAHEASGDAWLLDVARKLQAQGVDYRRLFASEDITLPTPRRGQWKWTKHVVNVAMAIKAPALSWRLDPHPRDAAFASAMIETLDRCHGQVTGMFSGDECLAGRNPLQGTELCAVVEFMYSLEHLFSVFGDVAHADRLERVAFNALPAAISPDGWSHQYDQQVNQVQCTINPEHGWSTNGPESNLFGLEPNYGCCTANMHQGWPKLVAHLWMRSPDEGLVAAVWAPCQVRATVRDVPVTLTVDTDYPFRETIAVSIETPRPTRIPLWLRVPAWAAGATVRVGGDPAQAMTPGSLHRVDREWNGKQMLTLRLPMRPVSSARYNDAVSVERGPLVYALRIGEQWSRVNADKPHREPPHADFEVRPTTPWNYALQLDGPAGASAITFEERPIGERPFSPEGAGVVATARGQRIPDWKLQHGWAGELAVGERAWSDPARPLSDAAVEPITLIPYGCTNLRIAEFPRLAPMPRAGRA